ncbi:hypothetical protein [Microbacterium sp. C7(2022)]|uniref:hypothetical protein n=1 Tax=Microbacterium sp. C7(2022) TaxID=2992759 RepID=UPI00237C5167|nr:hypothetical protein [Microbacterium sp. C7(2022)]MDE0546346.1 hypothetical protein [Microbacterium sp. C7(2022)]
MGVLLEVAVEYDKDWTVWWWVGAAVIGALAVALAATAPTLWGVIDDHENEGGRGALLMRILLSIAGIAALVVLVVLPGTMMRHIEIHSHVWWVVFGWGLAAVFLWWAGSAWYTRWLAWVPAIAIGAGVIVGAGNDALHRLASWIPMAAGTLLTLIVVGVVALVLYNKAQD